MLEQWIVFATLIGTLAFFIWGKWRYDIVAVLSLIVISATGIITTEEAFSGFGNIAVITVASVLILSQSLINSGIIDLIGDQLSKFSSHLVLQLLILTSVVTLLSAFMNNIGALAIMLPVAIQLARKTKQPLSKLLMPIAFGSLLGGMITVIGTPPNIIISTFRRDAGGASFSMFDFSPLGVTISIIGILFISIVGYKLIPIRKGRATVEDSFHIEDYLSEVLIEASSPLINQPLKNVQQFSDGDLWVVGILRNKEKIPAPSAHESLHEGDILLLKASSSEMKGFINKAKVKLVPHGKMNERELASDDIVLVEAVIYSGSQMEGLTVKELHLRYKYGVNVLGISRKGEPLTSRMKDVPLQTGDVLLLQGPTSAVQQVINEFSWLPLPERGLRIGGPKKVMLTIIIFIGAILATTFGLLNVAVAFTTAALMMIICGVISIKEAYKAIEWPIIILLGAMLPLGTALEKTGGAELLAQAIIHFSQGFGPGILILALLIVCALLSNVINNAATAVLLAPIAISIATSLGLSIDPFLMAVAIGSSTSFMTPIAHQSNLLVMGPGGYQFSDYARLGLPLTSIVIAVAYPMILLLFPL
ncbi:SLC13 family permease [Bacillus horti]